ncbi:hypothetical protein [Streptosporangium sp. NPDC004631]
MALAILITSTGTSYAVSVNTPEPQPDPGQNSSLVIGGDVIRHDSIQNLVIAKDIRDRDVGYGGNCHIWNWNGGNSPSEVKVDHNCWTASMNGRTYSWTLWSDTDAFTLQYERYWLNMHGTWHRIGANVYTKIGDHENAHCYRRSDGVNCYVQYG